jgi:hypothetical protein
MDMLNALIKAKKDLTNIWDIVHVDSAAASNLPHFKPYLALPRKLFGDTP